MKALIFAAGLGTRLKPFTLDHPKALVPVGGEPMLQRVILKLKDAGITGMVVNVHHFAGQIIDFLRANGDFGVDIAISDESGLLLDTGGGILAARRWLDDGESPVVVHNADIMTDFSIASMVESHNRSGADATLLVAERQTSRYLLMDGSLRMRGWTNTATGQVILSEHSEYSESSEHSEHSEHSESSEAFKKLAFGGVHVVSPSVFTALDAYARGREAFPIMPFYINACGRLVIRGYEPAEAYRWFDVGKPEALARAEAAFG